MPEISELHSNGLRTETVVKGNLTAKMGVDHLKEQTKLVPGLLGVGIWLIGT